MRIGFEGFPVDPVEIAKIMEDSGAAAIAVTEEQDSSIIPDMQTGIQYAESRKQFRFR